MAPRPPTVLSRFFESFRRRVRESVEVERPLTEEDMWGNAGGMVWKAPRFDGHPDFYPVYRSGDYYSFSPLALAMHKGHFDLDHTTARKVRKPGFRYLSSSGTLDAQIRRIGGPLVPTFEVRSESEYLDLLIPALIKDIHTVEARHPGFVNVIMCGGKDSLNLLLLPWKNPVLAASGQPNFPLVQQFVADNHLDIDVVELDDSDRSLLPAEVLVNFCRNDLRHCRWSPSICRLIEGVGGKAIIWKGQAGNGYMTDYWSYYGHPRWVGSILQRCPEPLVALGRKTRVSQHYYFWSNWHRCAMWQGVHMGILRELSGALTLSAYHGPEMRKLIETLDFERALRRDLRADIGMRLAGQPVKYPSVNPAPPLSAIRANISALQPFLQTARRFGLLEPAMPRPDPSDAADLPALDAGSSGTWASPSFLHTPSGSSMPRHAKPGRH